MQRFTMLLIGAALAIVPLAEAQSTVSPGARFAYSGNVAWIDFRPSAADGVVVGESFLSGRAWAANVGWIDFGDGSPANGYAYSNSSAVDFGVNLGEDGLLQGYAYGANIGWITFEQIHGRSRLDFMTGRITGHAWSANLGWIALSTPVAELSTTALARTDSDGDGISDAWEMKHFSGSLTGATALSNADGDSETDLEEYRAGTDPRDPGSNFRIVSHVLNLAVGTASIEFTSRPNRRYRIESAANPGGVWTTTSPGWFAPSSGLTSTRSLLVPGGQSGFFRVAVSRPLEP